MITRIVPILLVLVSIGLFVLYINPTYTSRIVPLRAELAQYNSALAAAEDFNTKEAQLAKERSAIPPESIAKLESYLPDGVDNVQLILDLNGLAARSGVQLSNFNIRNDVGDPTSQPLTPTSGTQTVDSLDVTVKAVGTYNAFRSFLNGVEHSLRPLDLIQMTVSDSATGVYSYDMTFRMYWLH